MPLFRRRPLLRAAAVGGGAYLMGKHRERRQEDEQQQAYYEGQQAATTTAPTPHAASGITAEDTQRLADLGRLHEQGILTDEEFAQQKARILGTA